MTRRWLLLLLCLPLWAEAQTLRCGNALLSPGDPSARLLLKCGQPLLVEDLTRRQENLLGEWQQVKYAERWTYYRGPARLLQLVTLENGRITAIENGPRG